MGSDPKHKVCSIISLQSLTLTFGDEARAMRLMARSGSGKSCGGIVQRIRLSVVSLPHSSCFTLFCLAEMQTPSCSTRSEGMTSSCFDTCLSDISVT